MYVVSQHIWIWYYCSSSPGMLTIVELGNRSKSMAHRPGEYGIRVVGHG